MTKLLNNPCGKHLYESIDSASGNCPFCLTNERDELKEKLEKAERERDLAIAHDTQPYPTADAYEKVCAALETHKRRADSAEADLRGIIHQLQKYQPAGSPPPGGSELLAIWVLQSLQSRAEKAEHELAMLDDLADLVEEQTTKKIVAGLAEKESLVKVLQVALEQYADPGNWYRHAYEASELVVDEWADTNVRGFDIAQEALRKVKK